MNNLTVKEYIEAFRADLTFTNEEQFFNDSLVMVVEVPHQRKAQTFYYYDSADYVRDYLSWVEEDADKGDGIEYTEENRVKMIEEYAGHDLHSWRKLVGIDEILNFIPTEHQRLETWRAITNDLYSLGIVEEAEEEDED